MALTKVSGGILDPGINVAGIVTATGFSGPFIGGGGVNAGIVTATGLDVNGNGDISGTLVVGNIGGTPTFTGDVNFNGNVSIAQTLTYADVTNIDSVGIVTARQGVSVPDNQKINVGTGNDLFLEHDGNNSVFRNTTGDFYIQNNGSGTMFIQPVNNVGSITAVANGRVELAFAGNKKFETINTGVTISGANATGSAIKGSLSLQDEGGTQNIVHLPATGKLRFADNKKATFGNSDDLEIYHSTNNVIQSNGLLLISSDNTNNVKIMTKNMGQNSARFIPDGAAELYHNGSKKFETSSIGVDITGMCTDDGARHDGDVYFIGGTSGRNAVWDMSDNALEFADNAQAHFGTGNDFKLWHDGSNSNISNDTGILRIIGQTGQKIDFCDDNYSTFYARFSSGAGIDLRYNNGVKFQTTSTGISVTGNVDAGTGGFLLSDDGRIRIGNAQDFELYHDGSHSIINDSAGSLLVRSNIVQISTPAGSKYFKGQSGIAELYHSDSKKFETTSAGASITGDLSISQHLDLADNSQLRFGAPNGLNIWHDGGNTYMTNQQGNFYIRDDSGDIHIQGRSNESSIICNNDGSVEIYFDNVKKFESSSTGVTVTGEVAASQDYPDSRPTLDLNFAAQKKLDPRITYQRTGVASFVNEFGKVVFVGDNAPRFDHDPDTGECKGLLIEESRTNIAPYSTDLSQYSGYNITKTANNAVAPDGTTTAAKLEHGGSGTSYLDHINTSINAAGAGSYTYSVWLKAPDDQPDGYYGCRIAVLHSTGGNVEPTVSLNKTWTRYSVTKTFSASDPGNLRVHLVMFRASPGATYDGKVIPSYVWAWGAQIEAGAFATSYITDSGATRGADLVEITEEEFSEFYNRTEGSFVSEIMLKPSFPVTNYGSYMMTLSDGSYNNRVTLASSTGSAQFNADINIGSTSPTRANLGSYTSGSHSIKAAMAYKISDSAGSLNGAAAVTSSPSGTLPLLTRADIGKDHANYNLLNGHVKRIMYYPKRLSNNQLRTLTS